MEPNKGGGKARQGRENGRSTANVGFQVQSQPPPHPAGSSGAYITLQSWPCLKARELGLPLNFEIYQCADTILHPLSAFRL